MAHWPGVGQRVLQSAGAAPLVAGIHEYYFHFTTPKTLSHYPSRHFVNFVHYFSKFRFTIS